MNDVDLDCTTPNRPYILGVRDDLKRAVLFQPRCKQWSCPYCSGVNQARWAARAYMGTATFQDRGIAVCFLTLTSHESLNPIQTRWVFPRAWKKLSQRARRAAEGFEYLMVPEQHEDGRLHIHAVETSDLGEGWWKDNARQSGLGYMDEETHIRKPQGAAAYVAKYLSKSLEVLDWPGNFHRVRTSRRWPPLQALETPPGWEFRSLPLSTSLQEVYQAYARQGYAIRLLGSSDAWRFIESD